MAEVATGAMSQPDVLRTMLANCATWQAWTESANATEALTHIFVEGFREDDQEGIITRPRAVTWINPSDFRLGNLTGVASGIVYVRIEADVPEEYKDDKLFADAGIVFRNKIGAIMSELRTLARSIAGGYLALAGDIEPQFFDRSDEDLRETEGDYYAAQLAFPFGI